MMSEQFRDKVIVITGANNEQGRAYSRYFAKHGGKLILHDTCDRELREFVQESALGSHVVSCLSGDLSVASEAEAFIAQVIEQCRKIDVLINNKAVSFSKSLLDSDSSQIVDLLSSHLLGTIHTTKAVLPFMLAADYGRIINTSSGIGAFGAANYTAYSAACAGVAGFSRSLGLELCSSNVMVNVIAPIIASEPIIAGEPFIPSEQAEGVFSQHPFLDPAMYTAQLTVAAVAYLAHDSCLVNGRMLSLTGGRIAQIFTSTVPGFFNYSDDLSEIANNLDSIFDTDHAMTPDDFTDELLMIDI
jgi:NAD(P)-dependent dehydrogenase (short-subunit alcohol dehydrogenase family)